MKHSFYVIISLLAFVFISSFILDENPYFKITPKDIIFKNPKGFPKPLYNFKNNKITVDGFSLGRKLFYDPILSYDYSTSCSFCHQQFAAFSHLDHPVSHGFGNKIGTRNAPALQNLIWKDAFMADGGITHLDLQPIAPITNEIEMGETLAHLLQKLQADTLYPRLFYKAFGDSIISTQNLMKSFSQFLALIISSNSRYDKYMDGNEKFNPSELNGLKLFRINCSKCHPEPLFTDNKYHNTLLKSDIVKDDKGRQHISNLPEDYFKFRTPSLRNIEMSYPYMHDGRFFNLEQVMTHYASSVNCANGKLTEQNQKDLIAFLKSLTDMDYLHDRRFADPNTAGN